MKHKKGVKFIFTTVIGGLLFLVPVVFLGIVLTKAAGFMMVIAQPLAAWVPVDSIGGVALANLIAIVAVMKCTTSWDDFTNLKVHCTGERYGSSNTKGYSS